MAFSLTTTAFEAGGTIPPAYTCDGEDRSPALEWTSAPQGTKSFALIMDDPDAPRGVWVHWVAYNIPSTISKLPSNIEKVVKTSSGMQQGNTDFQKVGYYGPCPPKGPPHRYFFTLYALDTTLNLSGQNITKKDLEAAMQGHILAKCQLMGKYGRT